VSEADVSKLKLGMPVYFTTLGEPDKRRYGTLRQILPTPEVVNNVVLYDALFDVPNPDHALQPQMSAQVFFVLAEAKNVPLVPVKALRPVERMAGGGKKDAQAQNQKAEERNPGGQPASSGDPAAAPPEAAAKTGDAAAAGDGAPRVRGKRYTVWVKNGDAIEDRKIVVGVSNRLVAEVRDGLKPGDEVMVDTTQAGQRPGGQGAGQPRPPRL
jgi:macrolide-specific efflux system membrane fusion protein